MKLPPSVHAAHPWLISEIAPDFRLLDAWALPATGRRDEFDEFLDGMISFDPARADSTITRFLFDVRARLGSLLGWDDDQARPIPGSNDASLRERMSDPLRAEADRAPIGGALAQAGFRALYVTDEEWAAEASNATMHGVLHVAWVEEDDGTYRGRLAIYVKPRGWQGEA